MIKNMTNMRKLSKMEIRDYARTLVPILESHELDGTKSMRIADAILSYAFKGLKPWYRRGSALQGFASSANPFRVIEGYLVYPTGLQVTIQTPIFSNTYLLLDIISAGGGGGGGGSGIASSSAGNGQGGGGGADGGRLIVITQGPLPAGTQLTTQSGPSGGIGGTQTTSTTAGNPGGAGQNGGPTQVILGGASISNSLTVLGGTAPPMPTPASGQAAGGPGGNGGSAQFVYMSNTSILSAIEMPPRTTVTTQNGNVNNGYGGFTIPSEYFDPSNTRPIFVHTPIGATLAGGSPGSPGGNGQSATSSVPSGMIALRGGGAGGGGGSNGSVGYAGGNGGSGGPGPIIILVIG